MILLSMMSLNVFASQDSFTCKDKSIEVLTKTYNFPSEEVFLELNKPLFFCRTKKLPQKEIFEWGNRTHFSGIVFDVVDGQCVVATKPYYGQNDEDPISDEVKEYCSAWQVAE